MAPGSKIVASILVADRPGIMRDITTAITDLGGNIDGISQTVVEGYFSVILTAAFPQPLEPPAVQAAIACRFGSQEASIVVRPFVPVPREPRLAGGQRYLLVVSGRDQPGILKRTTTCLAARGINIEDWSFQFDGTQVTYIGQLTVPRNVPIGDVQRELHRTLGQIDLRCTLQHENIFRATNEVGPIKSLLQESADAAQP
ncbi:MAG: ACT domain-containing protein [Lentisphaerae bacterium]|nr:ACT domain-containing protein [Lentisphaerota bacterium]